jgi:hypothetical protein
MNVGKSLQIDLLLKKAGPTFYSHTILSRKVLAAVPTKMHVPPGCFLTTDFKKITAVCIT